MGQISFWLWQTLVVFQFLLIYSVERWSVYSMDNLLPLISLSFLNHRMSAAGLLPEVLQVSVIVSFSKAGFIKPAISGFSGTPERKITFFFTPYRSHGYKTFDTEHLMFTNCSFSKFILILCMIKICTSIYIILPANVCR